MDWRSSMPRCILKRCVVFTQLTVDNVAEPQSDPNHFFQLIGIESSKWRSRHGCVASDHWWYTKVLCRKNNNLIIEFIDFKWFKDFLDIPTFPSSIDTTPKILLDIAGSFVVLIHGPKHSASRKGEHLKKAANRWHSLAQLALLGHNWLRLQIGLAGEDCHSDHMDPRVPWLRLQEASPGSWATHLIILVRWWKFEPFRFIAVFVQFFFF